MKPDTLEALSDSELQSVIAHAQGLLKSRDEGRKAAAMEQARNLLASVGLSLKDLNGKGRSRPVKAQPYKGGHLYRHPADKALVWNAKGQKPNWLRELEASGGKAVEVANG